MNTRWTEPLPAVVRSRQHLISQGVQFLPPGAVSPSELPIIADGVTYSMAQEAAWIDERHFAVGRWDGSLSIFAFNDSPTAGPVITTAVNTPAFEGVQMITWLAPGVFCSSNDEHSMALWAGSNGGWANLRQLGMLHYGPNWGVANSGDSLVLGTKLYFAAGHANGFVSLWEGETDGNGMRLLKGIDLRNPKPTNPWGLHNIRGLATVALQDDIGYIVSGSEDGYISILRLPDGAIISQTIYNPQAKRGINSVAAFGPNLLIANCAVGDGDKNLWYYTINTDNWSMELKDSTNLRVNPSAPQVFNFCSIWGISNGFPCFFSSTEEGALWMGTIDRDQRLTVLGYRTIYGSLGSALAFSASGCLVAINYNLYEFRTQTGLQHNSQGHPELLPNNLWPRLH